MSRQQGLSVCRSWAELTVEWREILNHLHSLNVSSFHFQTMRGCWISLNQSVIYKITVL